MFDRLPRQVKRNYLTDYPVSIYLLKVKNRHTRTRREICSKLTIKTTERRHCRRSSAFIFKFEHISHLVLVPLVFLQVNAGWVTVLICCRAKS